MTSHQLRSFSFIAAEDHFAAIACPDGSMRRPCNTKFILSATFSILNGTLQQCFANSVFYPFFPPGGHPVLDLCGMVRRTRRTRVVKVGQTRPASSGAPVAHSTTAADALRVVASPAQRPRRPRQEVTHLQRKRPLPRPSRVGLSRKEPAHRHLPSFTIVRVSLAARAKHCVRTDVLH